MNTTIERRVPVVLWRSKNTKNKTIYEGSFCGLNYSFVLDELDKIPNIYKFLGSDLMGAVKTYLQEEKKELPTNEQMMKELIEDIEDTIQFSPEDYRIEAIKFLDVVIEN